MPASPSRNDLLLQHVICLDDSRLAPAFGMNAGEQVTAIFRTHLPQFVERQPKRADGRRVPVMFWAHGGLVAREPAVDEALKAIPWWLKNGIYPIYFVWDTSLGATVLDVLSTLQKQNRDHRAQSSDAASYPKIKEWDEFLGAVAQDAGGKRVWGQMQAAAQTACSTHGGAMFVVTQLTASELNDKVALHAVGHSAGCIFHAYFLQALVDAMFTVDTFQLLAPANTTTDYLDLLHDPIEKKRVRDVRMFALKKPYELADHLLHIYLDGSLLYFIRNVLDPNSPNERILGLQESYDQDKRAERPIPVNKVVWTPHRGAPNKSSGATTHTSFSKDPRTLESVAFNILRRRPSAFPRSGGVLGDLRADIRNALENLTERAGRRLT